METPGCQTSFNADTSLSVTATLPPKKRSLERGKDVCTEPKEINTLTSNLKSTKLPKTTLLNANQTLSVTAQLPPKKRCLDRVKEFCTEPQDINTFQSNSISAEVPKIILDVPEQSLIIHPRFQQKPFLDVEPQKTDPAPETALKNNEPAPLLFLEYNINNQEKKQGEPSEPPRSSIYSTPTQVPKTTLGAPEQSLIIHPHFQQKPFTGQQPEKTDPKSETALKNNESVPLLFLEYNNNDREKEQGEPSEPSRCCIHCKFNSTSAEVPKTTLGGPEQSLTIHPSFQQITIPDQEPQNTDPKPETALRNNESTPSLFLEYNINDREKEQGEPSEPPRRSFQCKFCRQCFSSTQALGGHQNAHRREREQQKAMNEAQGFGSPTSLNGLPGLLHHPLRRSYMGHPYHPYQREIQERPVFSHPGIGLGHGSQSSFAQAVERFMESSPTRRPLGTGTDPRWTPPYVSSGGPIRLSNGPANFNRLAGSNLTGYRQGMGNEANLIQRHRVEPSGLNLSVMSRGFGNVQSSSNQNESTELDLDLKL